MTPFEVVAVALIVVQALLLVWLAGHRLADRRVRRRLGERLRFETLLTNVSATLGTADAAALDEAIKRALGQMVVLVGVDRGTVDMDIAAGGRVRVGWAKPGIDAPRSILTPGLFPWTAATVRRGQAVRFARPAALHKDASVDRATYTRLGTRSHLSIPLRVDGATLGVLSFDAVRSEPRWPDELVDRLGRLGDVVTRAVERRTMHAALGERLAFERLLSDLSIRFASAAAVDLDGAVMGLVRAIDGFLGPGRWAAIEYWPRGGAGRTWKAGTVSDTSPFAELRRRLADGDVVRVTDAQGGLDGAATEDRSRSRSLVALPLRPGGVVVGALVATAAAGDVWPDALIEQLHRLSEAVAPALATVHSEREAARLRRELTHIGRVSALGELTASLAHELNQPLTAILNNAEVARHHLAGDRPNVDEVREILMDIVTDDKRASQIIRRLRGLLQKNTVGLVTLDINDVVGEVAHLVRADLLSRAVPMTLELASGLPGVRGDRVQLQQVILNLVLNGLDAMAQANGHDRRLVIRTSAATDAAVTVAVRDSGAGLAAADVERIFQPLYTTKADGLGMGLAIARSIIDAHGGSLHGSNNVGAGATFAFTLPAGRIA